MKAKPFSPKTISTQDLPTSFGEFKPVGHLVLALASDDDARRAHETLVRAGLDPEGVAMMSGKEMAGRIADTREHTSLWASAGWEIKQAEEFYRLALGGCGWLIVHAPDSQAVDRVLDLLDSLPLIKAEKYNELAIEDVTPMEEITHSEDLTDPTATRPKTQRLQ